MSKDLGEERRVVSLEELLVRASQLREYLNLLSSQIESYSVQISELQLVINTLDSIPAGLSDNLMVLDRLNTVFIPITVSENWSSRVLVNIGRNYYVKTTKEKASELINKRLENLRIALDEHLRRYQVALNEYNAIQRILSAVYAKAVEESRGEAPQPPSEHQQT